MCCSVTDKESKSFPPTQQGDFHPLVALKSDSKHKPQRLGKDKGVIFPYFFPLPSFIFLERVQVHCLCGQPKFTFHHKASLVSLICLGNKIVDLDKPNCSSFDLKFSCSYNKMMLIWIELGRWLFAGLYSAEWQHTFVAGGEDSKRFVMGQASVNNLRSQGVKGHGSCIPWNIVKAALGLQAGCTLRYLSEIL